MGNSENNFRLKREKSQEAKAEIKKEKKIKVYQPPGFEKSSGGEGTKTEAGQQEAGSNQCCCDAVCACDTVTSGTCTCHEVCTCDSVCTCNAECSCVGNVCTCQSTGGYYTYYATYYTYYYY